MIRRILIALIVLLPVLSFGQTTAWSYIRDAEIKPTGRYRTIKHPFITIYSPKTCNGRVMQMEAYCSSTGTTFTYWIDIAYYKKRLVGRKRYELWEICRTKL